MLIEFKKDDRGYILQLERDLFGAYVLERHWYGRHNMRGGSMRKVYLTEDKAIKEVQKIERRRQSHGYTRLVRPTLAPDY